MRSAGSCPTPDEVTNHLQSIRKKMKDNMDFSQFLKIMHAQMSNVNITDEIYQALKANDTRNDGMVVASELRNVLMNTGEKLSSKEVDQMFRALNVKSNGKVKYRDFVAMVTMPIPDY